jgi:magnesium-transporting ATPase (P-type)
VRSGKSTEVGAISKALIKPTNKKTLLQTRLEKLGKILVVLSVVLCAIVVLIGIHTFKLCVTRYQGLVDCMSRERMQTRI